LPEAPPQNRDSYFERAAEVSTSWSVSSRSSRYFKIALLANAEKRDFGAIQRRQEEHSAALRALLARSGGQQESRRQTGSRSLSVP